MDFGVSKGDGGEVTGTCAPSRLDLNRVDSVFAGVEVQLRY